MHPRYSNKLRNDAHCHVQVAMRVNGIVNLIRVAEQIRVRNLDENIAREDVEELVLQVAQLYGAAVEFDEQAMTSLDLPELDGRDNRNDLDKMLRGLTPRGDVAGDLLQLNKE
ncbi:hypothetical protein AB6802_09315 [Mesorhizobium sp. RCC_202]|uniref:hypothetical protein n=1 Tax=Mesorhizobium sp. RCC_202 TaxID=3239222 RepID=UPI001DA6C27D|nr:hypothetical protein [Mesorhizobium sp.]